MEHLDTTAWTPPPEVCAALLDELISDLSRSLAHEFHATTHRPTLPCATCAVPCANLLPVPAAGAAPAAVMTGAGGGVYAVGDIHGNLVHAGKGDVKCPCPLCHLSFPVSRFAPHLEKCLGLGGRTSRRRAPTTTSSSVSAGAPSAASGLAGNGNGGRTRNGSSTQPAPAGGKGDPSPDAFPASLEPDGAPSGQPDETELFGDVLFF